MEIDFLQNTFMLYIVCSMLVTWVCLLNSRSYKNGTKFDRLKETLFCCAVTGAVTVPLVDYFTTIPSSIALLVGALVGILGYGGIVGILTKLVDMFMNIIPNLLSGVNHIPTYRSITKSDDDDGEEPPPIRKRNARK